MAVDQRSPAGLQNRKQEMIKYSLVCSNGHEFEGWFSTGEEYDRLEKAAGLDEDDRVHDAAYEAASYGSFQIMGFHWATLGYPNVDSFVSHMYTHEKAHLEAFGKFCQVTNLMKHLQNKDWEAFAKGYNGPGYKQNKYDAKLAAAYQKYSS